MSRRFVGTLKRANGEALVGAALKFVASKLTPTGVPKGVSSEVVTAALGAYDITILDGDYDIYFRYPGKDLYTHITTAEIGEGTDATIEDIYGETIPVVSGDPSCSIPPSPTEFSASGALDNILLSWGGTNYYCHDVTEIWYSETNDFESKDLLGTSEAEVYAHSVGAAATIYYWIRFRNANGDTGEWFSVNSVAGTTGVDPTYMLELLANQLDSSHLANNLKAGINTTFYQDGEPTVKPDGSALVAGDTWIHETTGERKLYDGATWSAPVIDPSVQQVVTDLATTDEAVDGTIVGFFQPGEPTDIVSSYGDIWIDTDLSDPLTVAAIHRYEDLNGGFAGTLSWEESPNSAVGLVYLNAYLAQATVDTLGSALDDGSYAINLSASTVDGATSITDYVSVQVDAELVVFSGVDVTTQSTGKLDDLYIQNAEVTDSASNTYTETTIYKYDGTSPYDVNGWIAQTNADTSIAALADVADGKRTIYNNVSHDIPTGVENDLWIPSTGTNDVSYIPKEFYIRKGAAWSLATNYTEQLADFVDNVYAGDLTNLYGQIDGKIEAFFTLSTDTDPADAWSTDGERDKHLGDSLWYTNTSELFRYKEVTGTYSWERIIDEKATAAFDDAATAQDTADGKRRVFVATPTVPYDIGDLWSEGAGDLRKCITTKTEAQAYHIDDWGLATDYTNNTVVDALNAALADGSKVINLSAATVDGTKSIVTYVEEQIDNEVVVYSGTDVTTQTEGKEGDVFIQNAVVTAPITGDSFTETTIYVYDTTAPYDPSGWVVQTNASSSLATLADLADGKRTIYSNVSQTVPSGVVNDLWIPTTGTNDATYVPETLYIHNGTTWVAATKYTDDSVVDTLNTALANGTKFIDLAASEIDGVSINTYVADQIDAEIVVYSGIDHTETLTDLKVDDLYIEQTTETSGEGVTIDVTNTWKCTGIGPTTWNQLGDNTNSLALADLTDGKRTIYANQSHSIPVGVVNDIWLPTTGTADETYIPQEMYINTGASTWALATKYTDDTVATAAAELAATKMVIFYAGSTTPPIATGIGDLWVVTDANDEVRRWSGSAWVALAIATQAYVGNEITEQVGRCIDSNGDSVEETRSACITGGHTWETTEVIAESIDTVSTTVGNHTTTINQHTSSINGLDAQYTVKIDNNGYVSGFGLASSAADGVPFSEFILQADRFAVINPNETLQSVTTLTQTAGVATTSCTAHGYTVGDTIVITGAAQGGYNGTKIIDTVLDADTFTYTVSSGTSSPATAAEGFSIKVGTAVIPFVIDGGVTYINSAMIQDASIVSAMIGNAVIDNFHLIDGAIDTAKIADANITNAKIANVIQSDSNAVDSDAGWLIDKAGDAVFNNGFFRGNITGSTGIFGGSLEAGVLDAAFILGDNVTFTTTGVTHYFKVADNEGDPVSKDVGLIGGVWVFVSNYDSLTVNLVGGGGGGGLFSSAATQGLGCNDDGWDDGVESCASGGLGGSPGSIVPVTLSVVPGAIYSITLGLGGVSAAAGADSVLKDASLVVLSTAAGGAAGLPGSAQGFNSPYCQGYSTACQANPAHPGGGSAYGGGGAAGGTGASGGAGGAGAGGGGGGVGSAAGGAGGAGVCVVSAGSSKAVVINDRYSALVAWLQGGMVGPVPSEAL
jgi:hypothetical protein